ncbi:uncharacterized protein A1O5_10494 [Cladophialophora psammophila CBS 110553]|uniref:Uncharacterized protein n=1 Tax=Cladophialophora psammophila CBS 110553 TaxID=1182543 RepID=W9WE40_9EURO|nr:uncharacterized protein A1O5_10494 [Cladophialophora psammophila CBS 110553]EXJ66342.1 hypothetical protein A1O5_10494 [Cladophialophora psammophila CBS 110553]
MGRRKAVETLLKYGADINEYSVVGRTQTALQAACFNGDIGIISILIDARARIDDPARGYGGRTALQSAACSGNTATVTFLLEMGADVNAPCAQTGGLSALQAAFLRKEEELVELLLRWGANVNGNISREDGRNAIVAAVEADSDSIFWRLIAADPNGPPASACGNTALQFAIKSGNLDIVKLLLRHGADVNAPASVYRGRTALQAASQAGNLQVVELLLDHGAIVNTAAGKLPLFRAICELRSCFLRLERMSVPPKQNLGAEQRSMGRLKWAGWTWSSYCSIIISSRMVNRSRVSARRPPGTPGMRVIGLL